VHAAAEAHECVLAAAGSSQNVVFAPGRRIFGGYDARGRSRRRGLSTLTAGFRQEILADPSTGAIAAAPRPSRPGTARAVAP
jgi:hypothetical protein